MNKYKILWHKSLKAHLCRIMLGVDTWQEWFTDNDWIGIILGWLVYIIVVVSASPITFIISIIGTIADGRFAKEKIKQGNEDFIRCAIKYKYIKEKKDECSHCN